LIGFAFFIAVAFCRQTNPWPADDIDPKFNKDKFKEGR